MVLGSYFIGDLYSFNDIMFAQKLEAIKEFLVGVRFSDKTFVFK